MTATVAMPSKSNKLQRPLQHTAYDDADKSSLREYPLESPDQQEKDALLAFADTKSSKTSAAWLTLNERDEDASQRALGNKLVVSPYTTDAHLLDLDSVSPACQLIAKALTTMKAVREDYATAPYIDSFNWSSVIGKLQKLLEADTSSKWPGESFYIVVFRSQIPPTTDRSHLGGLDEAAHAEAMDTGGLLKYWFGIPDSTGRNLATCVWREFGDSKRGSVGKGHKQATKETRALYTEWAIDRLKLKIGPEARAWEITDWDA